MRVLLLLATIGAALAGGRVVPGRGLAAAPQLPLPAEPPATLPPRALNVWLPLPAALDASTNTPGGIARGSTPQFVLLTVRSAALCAASCTCAAACTARSARSAARHGMRHLCFASGIVAALCYQLTLQMLPPLCCHARVSVGPPCLHSFTLPHPSHLLPMQHDDAITSRTYDSMRSVTDGVEASGCPATATMFVTSTGTGACVQLGRGWGRRAGAGSDGKRMAAVWQSASDASAPRTHVYIQGAKLSTTTANVCNNVRLHPPTVPQIASFWSTCTARVTRCAPAAPAVVTSCAFQLCPPMPAAALRYPAPRRGAACGLPTCESSQLIPHTRFPNPAVLHSLQIADHTVTHKSFLTQSRSSLEKEILGAREAIAECGIPERWVGCIANSAARLCGVMAIPIPALCCGCACSRRRSAVQPAGVVCD